MRQLLARPVSVWIADGCPDTQQEAVPIHSRQLSRLTADSCPDTQLSRYTAGSCPDTQQTAFPIHSRRLLRYTAYSLIRHMSAPCISTSRSRLPCQAAEVPFSCDKNRPCPGARAAVSPAVRRPCPSVDKLGWPGRPPWRQKAGPPPPPNHTAQPVVRIHPGAWTLRQAIITGTSQSQTGHRTESVTDGPQDGVSHRLVTGWSQSQTGHRTESVTD